MTTIYGLCAVVGGTVLVCQFIMALVGLSGDHDLSDVDADMDFGDAHDAGGHADGATADQTHGHGHHSSTWFFGVISFRTVVAALAFFGLTGLAVQSGDSGAGRTLGIAVAAGVAAMYGVHWLMQQMSRLNADGTIGIREAVGQTGTVYLKVQGHNQGAGKITLNLRNRTVEFDARTAGDELPNGTQIVVLGVLGPDMVEVGPVPATVSA
jgi:hypothetical protein